MPRPIAFNEEHVLSASMKCFWRKGFTATSIKDLELATGLTPSSLYNSFVSKDNLFLISLDHYIELIVRGRVQRFLTTDKPIEGIEAFFLDCFQENRGSSNLGCLLINTSAELGPHNEAVRSKVSIGMKEVVDGLFGALTRAQVDGSLGQDIDPKDLASHLSLLLSGMIVKSKTAKNNAWVKTAMRSVTGLLH